MTNQQRKPRVLLLLAGLCGLGLWAGSAAAGSAEGSHLARQLDRMGDRIERYYDHEGDRIARKLRHRAERLRAHGRYAEARDLERRARRVDRRLDRKGRRLNHELDLQARELRHRDHDRVGYRQPPPRHPRPAALAYGPPRPGVVLGVDLGRWVITP